MAKNEMKLWARMTFVVDKMVKNMKKCLDKNKQATFARYPAIEPENGLMIATDGHILAATKLKDYRCELGEGVFVVNGARMVPVEVTKMKGTVTVEIWSDGHDETVRVKDGQGTTAQLKQEARYPNWRTAMPWNSGMPIPVDAKAWDAVLKEMLTVMGKENPCYPMRLYGEQDGKTIKLSHYNVYTDEEWSKTVEVGWMPYKMFVSFDCKRMHNIMALQPTAMRFYDSTRPVMFYNDDTLMLLMPILACDDDLGMKCEIEKKDYDRFDLAKWMMSGAKSSEYREKPKAAKMAAAAQPQHTGKSEPTFADRLREALLKHYKAAA